MPTEADTCRMFVVPKLHASGWESVTHSIAELVHEPDADGKQHRVVKLTDYTACHVHRPHRD
jgi:hypothetical protein